MLPKSTSCEILVDTSFPLSVVLRRVGPSAKKQRREDSFDPLVVVPTPSAFRHTRLLAAIRREYHAAHVTPMTAQQIHARHIDSHHHQQQSTSAAQCSSSPSRSPSRSSIGHLRHLATQLGEVFDVLKAEEFIFEDSPAGRHYNFLRPRDVEASLLKDRRSATKPLSSAAAACVNLAPFSFSTAHPHLLLMAFLDASYWRTMRLHRAAGDTTTTPQELGAAVVNALRDLYSANQRLDTVWDGPDVPEAAASWGKAVRAFHCCLNNYAASVTSEEEAGGGHRSACKNLQRQIVELQRAADTIRSSRRVPSRGSRLAYMKQQALAEGIQSVQESLRDFIHR